MIRKSRTFRPAVADALEARTVPSSSGIGGVIASLPVEDSQQVVRAFRAFQQTYNDDVLTILAPPGTISPSSNRAAFDQAIGSALGTLNGSIDTSIANLPAAQSLGATIRAELLGTGPNTLQAQLATIPSPGSVSFASQKAFTREASFYINQMSATVAFQVKTAAPPSGSVSSRSVQQDLSSIQGAFRTFSQSYSTSVRKVLLPPGTTNPAANRAAFNQAVATSLSTLNTTIDSALSNLPSSLTATLDKTVQDDLLTGSSTSGNSLQSRLAALQTPTATQGSTVRIFQIGSTLTVVGARLQVDRDVVIAVGQFNAALNGS
jgi:hypothetical protein